MFITRKKHEEQIKKLLEEISSLKQKAEETENFLNSELAPLVQKAVNRIIFLEKFYNDTLIDIDNAIEMLTNLMKRRQVIEDDSDIQNVYQVITTIKDILLGYKDAKRTNDENERNSEE